MAIAGLYTYAEKTIGHYFIWFDQGINAIYGSNGSGKSYLLESVHQYLTGDREARGGVLIRIADIGSRGSDRLVLEPFVGNGLKRRLFDKPYQDPDTHTWFDASPVNLEDVRAVEDTEHNHALINEVNQFGYLLLSPTGRTPASWQVWPVVFPSSDTPFLNAEAEKWNSFALEVSRIENSAESLDESSGLLDDATVEQLDALWLKREDLHSSLLANSQASEFLNRASRRIGSNHHGAIFLRSPGQIDANLAGSIFADGVESRMTSTVPNFDVEQVTRVFLEELTIHGPPSDSESSRLRRLVRSIGLDPEIVGEAGYSSVDAAAGQVQEGVQLISLTAREILGNLLLDPIPLELRLGTVADIWAGRPATWGFEENYEFIPLEDFSDSQKRWARFAIYLALNSWLKESPATRAPDVDWPIWLIDEPERGMHRQAEEFLARGLPHLAERFGAQAFVATHSPDIINDPKVDIIQTRKGSNGSTFHNISRDEISSLAGLGLRPSDLLNRIRLFVIVEGEHEKVLFTEFFGTEFTRNRIEILVARGASNFDGIFDSQLISRFSNARVLLTIDNQEANRIQKAWETAKMLATTKGVGAAEEYLKENLPAARKAENKFLREFMLAAIRAGEADRIEVFGFEKQDIIEYLPSQQFTNRDTWDELRIEWEQSNTQKPFKPWLERSHGASFDSGSLRSAALSMDTIPDEFSQFLQMCLRLSEESSTQVNPKDFE